MVLWIFKKHRKDGFLTVAIAAPAKLPDVPTVGKDSYSTKCVVGERCEYLIDASWDEIRASFEAQLVKNAPANEGDLGWEDPLEKGKAPHSSILAWRIPWTVYSPWGHKESDTAEWLSLSLSPKIGEVSGEVCNMEVTLLDV